MHTVTAKKDGCVVIDGNPYQIGDIAVKFINNGIRLAEKPNNSTVILEAPFTEITNPATGTPFVSWDALKEFANGNFFDNAANDALLAAKTYSDSLFATAVAGVGNATLTTVPDPALNAYNVTGGPGTYINFLSAAATPIVFDATTDSMSVKNWQMRKVGTYWQKYEVKGGDVTLLQSTNLVDVSVQTTDRAHGVGVLLNTWVPAGSGGLTIQTGWMSLRKPCLGNTVETIAEHGGATLYSIRYEYADNSLLSYADLSGSGTTTITTPADARFYVFGFYRVGAVGEQPFLTRGRVNAGATALPYEKYYSLIKNVSSKGLVSDKILSDGAYKDMSAVLDPFVSDANINAQTIFSKNIAKTNTAVTGLGFLSNLWPAAGSGSMTVHSGWESFRAALPDDIPDGSPVTISGLGSATLYTLRIENSTALTATGNQLSSLISYADMFGSGTFTFIRPVGAKYICFGTYRADKVGSQPFRTNGMINVGSSPLPYEDPDDVKIIKGIKDNPIAATYAVINGESKSIADIFQNTGSGGSVSWLDSNIFIILGCSYVAGWGGIELKNWVNKLQSYCDWRIDNQGVGGNRMIDILNRLRNNIPQYGSNPQNLHGSVVWMACQGNEFLPQAYDSEIYMKQLKSLVEFAKSMGAIVVISTDHHVNQIAFSESAIRDFALENGCYFIPSAGYGVQNTRKGTFQGFYDGGHPGTRTNTHQFLTQMEGIKQLPRPKRSITMFRKRSAFIVSNLNDLNFDDSHEMGKKWRPYNVGEKYIPTAFVDDMPGHGGALTANSEYATPVAATGYTLIRTVIENINPSTISGIIEMTEVSGMAFYVKDLRDASTWEEASSNSTSFNVTKAIWDGTTLALGAVYSGTNVTGTLTYSGKSYDPRTGWLLTFILSGTNTGSAGAGTLTKVSGTGETTIAFLKNDASINYSTSFLSSIGKPEGAFVTLPVTYSDGAYRFELTDTVSKYLEYDKLHLIAYNASSYTITNVIINYEGGTQKNLEGKELPKFGIGTEILGTPAIDASATGWTLTNGAAVDQIPSAYEDYPYYVGGASGHHVNISLDSDKVSGIMKHAFTVGTTTNTYRRLIVRVSARLFPKIYLPSGTPSNYVTTVATEQTPDSWDFGHVCVSLTTAGNPLQTFKRVIGTGWSFLEMEIEIPPFTFNTNVELSIYRDSEDVVQSYPSNNWPMQVCYVSAQVI